MKLSIITINYNNLEGLRRTVKSVMLQTWRDFEWIIIDGGSIDGSREFIEEIASNPESNISFWCSGKDKGVYNAMNKGILRAKGDYLNFMNSGDCFFEDSTLQKVFETNYEIFDIIYGDVVYNKKTGQVLRVEPQDISLSFLLRTTICHQSAFIKRSALSGLYDENLRIVSDWKFWIESTLYNRSFLHVDLVVSLCDETGISGNPEKCESERAIVLSQILSDAIHIDMKELSERRDRDAWNPELTQTYSYLVKRHLYKRLINWNLKFLQFIDHLLE